MSVQVIKEGNQPRWAVVPYEEYLDLVERADMLQDIQDYDNVKAALARGDEELIPVEVIDNLLDGGNAIKVWREYRGLSQQALSKKAEISIPYLSQLETGRRKGSMAVLKKIADGLNISIELILSS